ncbi:protein Brevis radix-like 4 isoform X1 [Amborella trichopoda]|uniref:protein Brevis radix-like 4 isoform X1 n=2 Tax=Amborella trichopoda TaxID=13333 RepID=UPI0005D3EFCD|nr:protein Brevis radix-like 4 isoform X1 [Amborella trichopoda]XP_011625294.1 protein Brevis radix-like 4 isoform X1 [Amborella trichopoda]|eukprot:XP_011625293.1 protein Brevis radix-like 4 isoform X1 [Amborella trichopoda]
MLTCIACSKHFDGSLRDAEEDEAATPNTKEAVKTLTAQIKDMALKVSGAYRHCKPCSTSSGYGKGHHHYVDSDIGSEGFRYGYHRTGSSSSTPRLGKEHSLFVDSRIKGISSGEVTPRVDSMGMSRQEVLFMEEEEPKEWVAQVEPGVLITFISLPQGGNDLKRIRFSREMFNKWQAQRWWAENFDKVMELYNVHKFNRQTVPLPTPPRSEDESSKMESAEDSPVTPPLNGERLPRNFQRPGGGLMSYSSSDSMEHHHHASCHARQYDCGLASTPNLSGISAKTERSSSMDASRTSSSRDADRSDEVSVSASNVSDQEMEWVEQDEPGVYITIRSLPGGGRELRRVRFSRERFGEMHARLWWEENRTRIHEQYL